MRDVPAILAEWRALERELHAASDDETRVVLGARIEVVRSEYAAAFEELDVEAHQLGRPPTPELRKPD